MRERNGTHTENMNEEKKQIQKNLKRKKRRGFPSIFTPFFPREPTKNSLRKEQRFKREIGKQNWRKTINKKKNHLLG